MAPTNIKREIQRKNTDKFCDELIKEIEKSSNSPFEIQLVHQVQRRFLHLLDDAKARSDDPQRIQQVLEVFCSDVIASYVSLSVPPQSPDAVFRVAQGMVQGVSDVLSQQLHAYTQPPPAAPPTH